MVRLYRARISSTSSRVCSGTICYDNLTACNGYNIVSSCATVQSDLPGYYTITFTFSPSESQAPICVIYTYPNSSNAALLIWTQILSSLSTGIQVNTYTRQEGTVDSSYVYPREIMERALRTQAVSLVLVHNHPTGNPTPSEADKELTRNMVFAAQVLQQITGPYHHRR
jgi:proteasome lid subunit RPN8/RPN11